MLLVNNLVGFGGRVKGLVLIDRTAGTNIGDMTGGAGLAAAFDGQTSEIDADCCRSAAASDPISVYAGKTLAASKVFGQAILYGSNGNGFINNENVSCTLNIRGKNGTPPSSPTDGTIVGTITFTDTSDERAGRTINSADLANRWDHLFVQVSANPSTSRVANLAELVLYEWA